MSEKREITVNVYRYSFLRELSMVLDILLVVGGSIANHRWGGGSAWLDAFFALLGFMVVLGIGLAAGRDQFSGTAQEAIAWLQMQEGDA